MTHQSNHRDLPVQKAGQAIGAALLQPSLPRNTLNFAATASGGAARVAGGDPGAGRQAPPRPLRVSQAFSPTSAAYCPTSAVQEMPSINVLCNECRPHRTTCFALRAKAAFVGRARLSPCRIETEELGR